MQDNTAENFDGAEVAEKPARKPRKPKLDENGQPILKAVKAPKEPKLYPVWNEDGTQAVNVDTGELMFSTERTKKPKVAKASAPKVVSLVCNGAPFDVKKEQNVTELRVVGTVTSKEGSKRSERAKAYEGASTVQDFFANGGVIRDLLRHVKSGAVELQFEGNLVSAI